MHQANLFLPGSEDNFLGYLGDYLKKSSDVTRLLCGLAAAKLCLKISPCSMLVFLKFYILIYTHELMSKTAMIITEI